MSMWQGDWWVILYGTLLRYKILVEVILF